MKPDNEMCQVINLCIDREVARIKRKVVKDYENKLSQVTKAHKDLSQKILDELIHIKTEHEQQIKQLQSKLTTQKATLTEKFEFEYTQKLQQAVMALRTIELD